MYVEDLARPLAAGDDAHHLLGVLRLRPGELVVASDGTGSWRACRVPAAGAPSARTSRRVTDQLELAADGPIEVHSPPDPPITIGFSLAKGDRTEWAAAKLTELGVDRIVPLICERTVIRPGDESGQHRLDRLQRIARAAAMQSRRLWLPVVSEPVPFEVAARCEPAPALAEMGGGSPSLERPVVLVGPEGGWSEAERSLGLAAVSLGPSVLRIETAAVAAAVLLTALRAGLVAGG